MATQDRTDLSYWRGLADEACPHRSPEERQELAERMYARVILRAPIPYGEREVAGYLPDRDAVERVVRQLDHAEMNESADDPIADEDFLVLGGQGRTGDDLRDDGGAWLVAALAVAIVGGTLIAIAWTVLP